MAFTGAGGSGKDQSLFSPGEVEGGQFHDLPFVEALLEVKIGSSLKCMGNQIRDMIEIRHQEMKEVDTDHHERHGFISVGIGFDTAMACGIV